MRAWWVLLVAAACGKSDKPDCAKYSAHMVEITGAGLDAKRKQSLEFSNKESCESGHVSAKEASCVMAATTADQIRECEGLAPIGFNPTDKPADTSKPPAPAPQRVQRQGFSVAVPAGWTSNEKKLGPSELLLRGPADPDGAFLSRQPGAPHGLESDAACRRTGESVAQKNGATVQTGQITQTKLGPSCHTVLLDPKMVVDANAVAAGADTMVVTCFYDRSRTAPAPQCTQILDSLKLD